MPFRQHGPNTHERDREVLRPVLPGSRYLRPGKMRAPGLLPLLHQDAGAVRAEVLRRLPGGARQGTHRPATGARGWRLVVLARPVALTLSFTLAKIG